MNAKFLGAISLGLIYYFYYDGGDTTLYFQLAKYITQSIFENPTATYKLLFSAIDTDDMSLHRYVGMNMFYMKRDSDTYFFIRFVTLFNLLS
ncbi:MAG: hypothetical protein MUE81_17940, partial [Thermoflexibacter sp.]|nr:hypothetical protein [Thermoflexibacter sp.]